MANRQKKATQTKAAEKKATEKKAPKATEEKAPEQEAPATEPTEEKAPVTKATPEDTFRQAVEAAVRAATIEDGDGTVPPAESAAAVAALSHLPKKDRDRARADVISAAISAAFEAGDVPSAQAANDLGSTLAAAASTAPKASGPTAAEVVAARLQTIGGLAADIVADALARLVPNESDRPSLTDAEATAAILAAGLGDSIDEALVDAVARFAVAVVGADSYGTDKGATLTQWSAAFGGRVPDMARVPGRRSGGGTGGGGRSKDRDLNDVPDGPIGFTYKGTDHEATLKGDTITFAGETYDSPSGAAKAATDGKSINGWNAWKVADGRTLAQVIDGEDA